MANRSSAFLVVHVVWTTLRRRPLLSASFDERLSGIVARRASKLRCVTLALGCASDHVHAVVRLSPTVALAHLVQALKGGSAHDVNQAHAMMEPLYWDAGYWAESVGPEDLTPLCRYVRDQRSHHDPSHPTECWLREDARKT